LLSNLALCGHCGGPLQVVSTSHGTSRKRFYGCSAYHERGTCENKGKMPLTDGDDIVIETLLDDVLDESIVRDAVDVAVELLQRDDSGAEHQRLEAELAAVDRERSALMAAIKSGDQLQGLYEALSALDGRRRDVGGAPGSDRVAGPVSVRDGRHLRDELIELASDWRRVLVDDPMNARPIVSSLLIGRVTFMPLEERHRWRVSGEGSLLGLFSKEWTGRTGVPNGRRSNVFRGAAHR
jgi:hypothetical protein